MESNWTIVTSLGLFAIGNPRIFNVSTRFTSPLFFETNPLVLINAAVHECWMCGRRKGDRSCLRWWPFIWNDLRSRPNYLGWLPLRHLEVKCLNLITLFSSISQITTICGSIYSSSRRETRIPSYTLIDRFITVVHSTVVSHDFSRRKAKWFRYLLPVVHR